jgi:hypothetical protein
MNDRLLSFTPLLCVVSCIPICLTLIGCSLPQPQPDPTRFYVLSTEATSAVRPSDAPTVQLQDVELAAYLQSRPVIVRRGENEIEFREYALWGEPLELGIARVLREELLARGAARGVTIGSRRDLGNHDFKLAVRVLACEGHANGDVAFRAVWSLTTPAPEGDRGAGGDYRAADLQWDGKSEASLAAQLSQAVAGLAGDIASALER